MYPDEQGLSTDQTGFWEKKKGKKMKSVVCYTTKEGYGYRENSFDWKIGDKIFSKDGKDVQRVRRVVAATPENLDYLHRVMNKCHRYSGDGSSRLILGGDGKIYTETKIWQDGTGKEYFLAAIEKLVAC